MTASKWKYFTIEELACSCGCGLEMNNEYMEKVVHMRAAAGFPFPVNSGARCESYDLQIGGRGPHRTGRALDIRVAGTDSYELVRLAFLYGMKGIGLKQHGDHGKRFIHIDDLDYGTRPWVWTY
jgi:hypothetical protein